MRGLPTVQINKHFKTAKCIGRILRGISVVLTAPWIALIMLRLVCQATYKEIARYVKASPSNVNNSRKQLTCSASDTGRSAQRIHLLLSSVLLQQIWETLVAQREENMVLVTGIKHRGVWIPTAFLPVDPELATMTAFHARAASSQAILRFMDVHHHALLMAIHLHPGTGVMSVVESMTDRQAQAVYERLGYHAVSGIVSRDGHVHVFTQQLPFHVEMDGIAVQEIRHGYWKITIERTPRVQVPLPPA